MVDVRSEQPHGSGQPLPERRVDFEQSRNFGGNAALAPAWAGQFTFKPDVTRPSTQPQLRHPLIGRQQLHEIDAFLGGQGRRKSRILLRTPGRHRKLTWTTSSAFLVHTVARDAARRVFVPNATIRPSGAALPSGADQQRDLALDPVTVSPLPTSSSARSCPGRRICTNAL